MPEAPEVRLIADSIDRFLTGKVLQSLDIVNDGFLKRTKGLEKLCLPQVVQSVATKGKFCYVRFADKTALGIGFGMTGNVRIEPTEEYLKSRGETKEKYLKHAMLRFNTADPNDTFYYHSMRRFGFVHFLTEKELGTKLASLGPSIMDPPIAKSQLLSRWKKSKNVCDALVNCQNWISGIGNYIKAEIMYRCGVHPMAVMRDLPEDVLYQLYLEACDIAQAAYRAGGASLYTFTGLHGDRSEFKEELQVYGRTRDPEGRKVETLKTPDKRTTHWVAEVQTIGAPVSKGRAKVQAQAKARAQTPKIRIKVTVKEQQ